MGFFKRIFLGTRLQQLDREAMLEQQINKQYDDFVKGRENWNKGERNPQNATIREWEYLNKPKLIN